MDDVTVASGPPARRPPRGRRAALLLLALVSLILPLVVFELFAYYGLNLRPPSSTVWSFFKYDSLLGHARRPNARGWWYAYDDGTKHFVSINAAGFTDAPRSLARTRPRIALIGDSATEFLEADSLDRGQVRLEKLLGGRYEVLNFGMRYLGTDQTSLLLEHTVLAYAPDIVIYTICINDIQDNVTHAGKPWFEIDPAGPDSLVLRNVPVERVHGSAAPPRFSLRASLVMFLRSHSFIYRRIRALIPKPPPPLADHFELRPFQLRYNAEDSTGIEVTRRLISRLDRLCRSHGARLLVVEGIYRPLLDEGVRRRLIRVYGDVFDFSRVTRDLDRHCRERGIPFLSLPRLARAQGISASELMHREDSIHLDSRGIRFWAQAIATDLTRRGWLHDAAAR